MKGESRMPDENGPEIDGQVRTIVPDRRAAPSVADAVAALGEIEGALVDRSIAFAKTNGYAPYTTTIRAAWTEAVRGVTEALGEFLTLPCNEPGGPMADADYRRDPRFARMRRIARRHRAIGITLELYIGLFKHFRRVYLDAIGAIPASGDLRAQLLGRTLDFFDEAELSVTADWTAAGDDQNLQELQARTRSLTLTKDRYVAIFESLRNPALLLDKSGRAVHANKAAIDLFLGEGAPGDGLYRHGRHELTSRLGPVLRRVLGDGTAGDGPVWVETLAGRRCFEMRLLPLHDALENTALGQLLQLYDVTAHREATEQAQRAERQMSRFLATMSHEIRTPLHSVLGAADLLRGSEGPEGDTYLDVIQSAGHSLLQTLNNVLDYSKLENGPPMPRPADTEIAPALEAVCRMVSVGPASGALPIAIEIAPEVPARLRIDWAMTRQILTNLLANALSHDDGRGVALRVGAGRDDAGGPVLRLEVEDHGPGLPAEASRALFRPFDELHARHTTTGGAGIGLAISRHLVCAMGGRIGFENLPTGALLWAEMPVAEASGPDAVADAADAGAATGGRCLLIDDDPVGALVSEHQLRRIGFSVERAGTIRAARAALARDMPDAVVVDYLLPDGTGPDLVEELARSDCASRPRIVALTANIEALNAAEDGRDGFDRVLAKPTDLVTLAKALQGCGRAGPASAMAGMPGLETLSPATVAAMTAALGLQWDAFRELLGAARYAGPSERLADAAHRLAGATAQLGLVELAEPLRALDRRSRAGPGSIDDLLDQLDRPLETAPSWRRLSPGGARA